MNTEPFLSKMYDEILTLSKINYEEVVIVEKLGYGKTKTYPDNCLLNISKHSAIPFGFEEFASIVNIEDNSEMTDSFLVVTQDDPVDLLPLEFYINVPIDKKDLRLDNVEMLAKCLLQLAYIKEVNLNDE